MVHMVLDFQDTRPPMFMAGDEIKHRYGYTDGLARRPDPGAAMSVHHQRQSATAAGRSCGAEEPFSPPLVARHASGLARHHHRGPTSPGRGGLGGDDRADLSARRWCGFVLRSDF